MPSLAFFQDSFWLPEQPPHLGAQKPSGYSCLMYYRRNAKSRPVYFRCTRQISPLLPHPVCTEPVELRANVTVRQQSHQRILKYIQEANLRSKKGSFTNPYQASHKQIMMSENISYLDDQSSLRSSKENIILHLSQKADIILKENSNLYCSTSFLSLQTQPRNTFVGHCFICSYT